MKKEKFVKLVFDRKKTVSKTGYGTLEICVYLSKGERMYLAVGSSSSDDWKMLAQSLLIQAKMNYYEQIIDGMRKMVRN